MIALNVLVFVVAYIADESVCLNGLNVCKDINNGRCDNVAGCVPEVGTFNTTAGNDNVTDISIESFMETITDFSKDHLLIYSLVATSIIFTVGTCFVCRRLQKKRARREVTAKETTSPTSQISQITNSENTSYISMEGNYLMKNTFTNKTIGPFIATEESNPPDKEDSDNDEDSNLHPYNNILKPESNSGSEDRPQKPFQTFRESLAESTENITNLDHFTGD
ncbi:unnamed protein product [Mytilus edulis]|uniref:Uncharacterized protein n=1 Tax=Mytilus edulis TaxID=6550 RepID=A0A8S3VG94_MYTED|nr:unnamed protein product [Mytilus edulis]